MALSGSSNSPLSRPGRMYVWTVILVGSLICAHALWVIVTSPLDPYWLLFAALTLVGGALTIKVPSLLALLSVSEMFGFTCTSRAAAAFVLKDQAGGGCRRGACRRQRVVPVYE